jgi:hypothetical protein
MRRHATRSAIVGYFRRLARRQVKPIHLAMQDSVQPIPQSRELAHEVSVTQHLATQRGRRLVRPPHRSRMIHKQLGKDLRRASAIARASWAGLHQPPPPAPQPPTSTRALAQCPITNGRCGRPRPGPPHVRPENGSWGQGARSDSRALRPVRPRTARPHRRCRRHRPASGQAQRPKDSSGRPPTTKRCDWTIATDRLESKTAFSAVACLDRVLLGTATRPVSASQRRAL